MNPTYNISLRQCFSSKANQMKKQTQFIFRRETGRIVYLSGESANHSLNQIGNVLSWDGDMNTVDVRLPSGKTEKLTFQGIR
jgi:hypothetical protein